MTTLNWAHVARPTRETFEGRFCRLEPLDPARHADDLWVALEGPDNDRTLWNYLPYGPFGERSAFDTWVARNAASTDPLFFAVVAADTGRTVGQLTLMSIVPAHGSIEIGHIAFGAAMQRRPIATEAVFLLARQAFQLGNRRLEWKCDNGNARSRRAAGRFGFRYEGLFRQHLVVKDRNRDTAWFSIIDSDWPACGAAFERWLAADNFDTEGQQRRTLESMRG